MTEHIKTFITFIIPTIGRESLKDSIESLNKQKDNDWKAIIIFDGVDVNIDINLDKIKIIKIDKVGFIDKKNCAGLVRNIGIKHCDNTEWIGFLDDDDYLSSDYICNLKEEIRLNNQIEICIFRMAYDNKCILPTKHDKNIIRTHVGISFSIKKYITDNIVFNNNPFEDYLFLKEAQSKKYKIIISSFVMYFIKTFPYETNIFPKVLINF
jgi:hypothetical protein